MEGVLHVHVVGFTPVAVDVVTTAYRKVSALCRLNLFTPVPLSSRSTQPLRSDEADSLPASADTAGLVPSCVPCTVFLLLPSTKQAGQNIPENLDDFLVQPLIKITRTLLDQLEDERPGLCYIDEVQFCPP